MNLMVSPGSPLRGELTLPGDKSLSHRSALFAALAEGQSQIENFLVAGVTRAMLAALRELGVVWHLAGASLTLAGHGLRAFQPPMRPLDCGLSATTMRLLAGALAGTGTPAVLDGGPGLRRRPMERVVAPLQAMGVPIQSAPGGGAPLRLAARPSHQKLHALDYCLPVASAQVKTALLLAALAADGPTRLTEPGPSRDHTERLLASMGVEIERDPPDSGNGSSSVTLHPPLDPLRPLNLTLPGDFSSAAFLIVAALITPGSEITLRQVGLNPTRTGLLVALQSMGADIRVTRLPDRHDEPVGDLAVRHSRLKGVAVAGPLVVRMIDEFPALAVAAAFAEGHSQVQDAAELRFKESDRIAALSQGLGALGVPVRATPDGFKLDANGSLEGGRVDPHGDHRLAMALAVAGLGARQPVTVSHAELISQSYPGYVEALQALGAEVQLFGA